MSAPLTDAHIQALAMDALHDLWEEMGEDFGALNLTDSVKQEDKTDGKVKRDTPPELELLYHAAGYVQDCHADGTDPDDVLQRLYDLDADELEAIAGGGTVEKGFDPNEARDETGRWTAGGAGGDNGGMNPKSNPVLPLGFRRNARPGLRVLPIAKIEFTDDWSDEVAPLDDNRDRPIIVYPLVDGTFQLIDGFGRTSGLRNAGKSKIHAIVVGEKDILENTKGRDVYPSDAENWVAEMHAKYAPHSHMAESREDRSSREGRAKVAATEAAKRKADEDASAAEAAKRVAELPPYERTGRDLIRAARALGVELPYKDSEAVWMWDDLDATKRIQAIIRGTVEKAFHPDQPRDDHGRWVKLDDLHAAKTDPKKAAELKKRVTDPEQRKKLDKVLSGQSDLAPSKRTQAKDESRQKRETVQASRTEAKRLADKLQQLQGDATAEDYRALIPHLSTLTHAELSYLQTMLSSQGASFGGQTRLEERRKRLLDWARGQAEGAEKPAAFTDAQLRQPPFPVDIDMPYTPGHIKPETVDAAPETDIPLDGLIATQSHLNPGLMQHLLSGGQGREGNAPVLVVRVGDKRYLDDGTHRASRAKLAGETTVRGKEIELVGDEFVPVGASPATPGDTAPPAQDAAPPPEAAKPVAKKPRAAKPKTDAKYRPKKSDSEHVRAVKQVLASETDAGARDWLESALDNHNAKTEDAGKLARNLGSSIEESGTEAGSGKHITRPIPPAAVEAGRRALQALGAEEHGEVGTGTFDARYHQPVPGLFHGDAVNVVRPPLVLDGNVVHRGRVEAAQKTPATAAKKDAPIAAGEKVDATERALQSHLEESRTKLEDYTPEKVNALLEGVLAGHSDDEVRELARRVTGRRGRTAAQARQQLLLDLSAVQRLRETQRV